MKLCWKDINGNLKGEIYFACLHDWLGDKELQKKLGAIRKRGRPKKGTEIRQTRSSTINKRLNELCDVGVLLRESRREKGRRGYFYKSRIDLLADYIAEHQNLSKEQTKFIKKFLESHFFSNYVLPQTTKKNFENILSEIKFFMTSSYPLYSLLKNKKPRIWTNLSSFNKIKSFDAFVDMWNLKHSISRDINLFSKAMFQKEFQELDDKEIKEIERIFSDAEFIRNVICVPPAIMKKFIPNRLLHYIDTMTGLI